MCAEGEVEGGREAEREMGKKKMRLRMRLNWGIKEKTIHKQQVERKREGNRWEGQKLGAGVIPKTVGHGPKDNFEINSRERKRDT